MKKDINKTPRKRRIKKKKVNKKIKLIKLWMRRTTILLFCFIIALSFVFAIVFALIKFFSIKNLIIEGNKIYTTTEIQRASEIYEGNSLLTTNIKLSEQKIYESFPYIDDVKIYKQYPNTVKINIEIAEPQYYIKLNDEYLIISKKKKILEKRTEAPGELINVLAQNVSVSEYGKVEYPSEEIQNTCTEIITNFKDKNLNNVKEINIFNTQKISINYDNRINIYLGDINDMKYKLSTVKEILINKIGVLEKGVLDVSKITKENRSYFFKNE